MNRNKTFLFIFTDYFTYKIFKKYLKINNNGNYKIKILYINNIFLFNYIFDENFKNVEKIDLNIKDFKIINYFKDVDGVNDIYIQYDKENLYSILNSIFIEKILKNNIDYNTFLYIDKKYFDIDKSLEYLLNNIQQFSKKISNQKKLEFFNKYFLNNFIEYLLSIYINRITSKFIFINSDYLKMLKIMKNNTNNKTEIYVLEKIKKNINFKNIKNNDLNKIYIDLMNIYLHFFPYNENLQKNLLDYLSELLDYNIIKNENGNLLIKKEYINKIDLKEFLKNKRIEKKIFYQIYYLLNFFSENEIEISENIIEYRSLLNDKNVSYQYNSNNNKKILETLFLNNKSLSLVLLSLIDNKNNKSFNEIFKTFKYNIPVKTFFDKNLSNINNIFNFLNTLIKKRFVTLKIENLQLSNKLIYLLNELNIDILIENKNKLYKRLLDKYQNKNIVNDKDMLKEIYNEINNELNIFFNISNFQLLNNVYKYIKDNKIDLKHANNKKEFIKIYKDKNKLEILIEKIKYKEAPTEKQLNIIKQIEKELNIIVPTEVLENKNEAKKFISENIKKLKKPTEKMQKIALKIIEQFNLNVNKEKILNSFEECQRFLSFHL